jgi:hypothetical protein
VVKELSKWAARVRPPRLAAVKVVQSVIRPQRKRIRNADPPRQRFRQTAREDKRQQKTQDTEKETQKSQKIRSNPERNKTHRPIPETSQKKPNKNAVVTPAVSVTTRRLNLVTGERPGEAVPDATGHEW